MGVGLARVFFAVLSVLSLAFGFPAAAEPIPDAVPATVLRVIDGDTILVAAHVWLDIQVTARVRLKGIDAPELNAPCAEGRAKAVAALALVRRIVGDGPVLLGGIEAGKYGGRVIARVTAGGADLAQALLAAGLARPYGGGKRRSWCGG